MRKILIIGNYANLIAKVGLTHWRITDVWDTVIDEQNFASVI